MKTDYDRDITGLLLNQLENLTHRGYQGCGLASFSVDTSDITYRKSLGNVSNLRSDLGHFVAQGLAIGHLRWFTHGREAVENSHPHLSNDQKFAVVHNGEIYNKKAIKEFLLDKGCTFLSDTDTECIPNLMEYYYSETGDVELAIQKTIDQLDGSNAMLIMTTYYPNRIYAYNNCQTISLVDTQDYYLLVSDDAAIPEGVHVQYHINDDDLVIVDKDGFEFVRNKPHRRGERIEVDLTESTKEGFRYFMEKEIFLQPETMARTLAGRYDDDSFDITLGMERRLEKPIQDYDKLLLIGIGTSYHACLIADYFFSELSQIQGEVVMGSEFFNKMFLVQPRNTLAILVSQSGKTAELLDIVKFLKMQGVETIAVCNVVKSPLARITRAGVFLKAGPEKAVASTKAYTSQMLAFHLIAGLFASRRGKKTKAEMAKLIEELKEVPELVKRTLEMTAEPIKQLAEDYKDVKSMFYLGRGITWPLMHEAALKMQEVAYVNARGYSAAEMFHGPRAMLDASVPCFAVVSRADPMSKQMIASIEKCHSTGAPVVIFVDETMAQKTEFDFPVTRIVVPDARSYHQLPYVNIIPFQLFAFYSALVRGYDPDFPRNLAKVITTR